MYFCGVQRQRRHYANPATIIKRIRSIEVHVKRSAFSEIPTKLYTTGRKASRSTDFEECGITTSRTSEEDSRRGTHTSAAYALRLRVRS